MDNKLLPWGSDCPKCGSGSYECSPRIGDDVDEMRCADCGCVWEEPMWPEWQK